MSAPPSKSADLPAVDVRCNVASGEDHAGDKLYKEAVRRAAHLIELAHKKCQGARTLEELAARAHAADGVHQALMREEATEPGIPACWLRGHLSVPATEAVKFLLSRDQQRTSGVHPDLLELRKVDDIVVGQDTVGPDVVLHKSFYQYVRTKPLTNRMKVLPTESVDAVFWTENSKTGVHTIRMISALHNLVPPQRTVRRICNWLSWMQFTPTADGGCTLSVRYCLESVDADAQDIIVSQTLDLVLRWNRICDHLKAAGAAPASSHFPVIPS
jgi:hypothetical protein